MAANAWEIRKRSCIQRDRISELSDEILGEILSSIPTEEAVRTSCLSKRWKSVWTSVRIVKIRDRAWFTYSPLPNMYVKRKQATFVNFVERAFNHLLALHKLELYCYFLYAKQWIDFVTNKLYAHVDSLDVLDLTLTGIAETDQLIKLPASIFTSEKLGILKLSFNVEQLKLLPSAAASTVFWLPSLKVLHLRSLRSITGMDVSPVENIIRGCPVLQELFLEGTMHNELNLERLCVKSSSLKLLKVHLSKIINSRIEIDASNLEELDLHFDLQDQIVIVNTSLPLLMRVTLNISIYRNYNPDIHVYGHRLIELLTKVSNTKNLFLSSTAMAYLKIGGFYQQLPMFTDLMDLNLDVCFSASWPILPWFLERSPNLVSFSICDDSIWLSQINQLQSQGTPNCSMMMRLHLLEKVELNNFQGSVHEMELVSYLLKKAPVLKKITVIFAILKTKVASRLHSRLVKLPKASTACKAKAPSGLTVRSDL